MADPISAAATAFASWVSSTIYSAATAVGFSASTASTISIYATALAYAGVTYGAQLAVTMGLTALATAQLPDPEGQKLTRKQPRPLRHHLVGDWSRFSGAFMLREATGSKLAVVLALADGRLDDIEAIYLNDDRVTLGGSGATSRSGWVQEGDDGRYGTGDLIRIETRLGEPTETHYSFLTDDFASVWPTTSRGDGIASLMMWCQHRSQESQGKLFPNGEPMPSVVGRAVCYDWRQDSTVGGAGAQRRDDPATWGPSANPVVWMVFVEWHRFGRNWARSIAPVLDELTAEADWCDELVAKVGGTEPRYACAGNYPVNLEPATVRSLLLATMDGWLSTNGKGHLIIKAGRFETPEFILGPEQMDGFSWRAFQRDEEAINELTIAYVSPEHDYTLIDAPAWRDEAAITAMGKERTDNLQLNWVSSRSQARRLAKRKMMRLNASRRGWIRTVGVYGLNGLGKRYIGVRNPTVPSMADAVLEVLQAEIDWETGKVTFEVILADPAIDDWDPATEEGAASGEVPPPDPGSPWVDPPTDLDFTIEGGTVTHTWRNGQTNFYRTLIFRNTTNDFGTAVQVASTGGSPLADMEWPDTPGSGDFYYWFQTRAFDAAELSEPVASGVVTLP